MHWSNRTSPSSRNVIKGKPGFQIKKHSNIHKIKSGKSFWESLWTPHKLFLLHITDGPLLAFPLSFSKHTISIKTTRKFQHRPHFYEFMRCRPHFFADTFRSVRFCASLGESKLQTKFKVKPCSSNQFCKVQSDNLKSLTWRFNFWICYFHSILTLCICAGFPWELM